MATQESATVASVESDVDLVRQGYAAFNAADIAALDRLFADNVTWRTPGRGPLAGKHTGKEAVFGQFGRYGEETAGTFRAALEDVYAAGDGRVIGVHRNTAERRGKRLDVRCCIVFQVRDGRVVEGAEHFDDLYAWDEFWS